MKNLALQTNTPRRRVHRSMIQNAAVHAVLVLVALIALGAPGASAKEDATPAEIPIPADILGSWHSTSIDGDALFLVVYSFQVDFLADGHFHAHVAFTDGQSRKVKGNYRVEAGNRLVFDLPKTKMSESVTYSFKTKDLVRVEDSSYGVRIDLNRGRAKKKSGDDWF